MEIRYAKIALKALQGYDRPTRDRIRDKIQGLTLTPPEGDIKPVVGEDGVYRLRVGKYRVKYAYRMVEEIQVNGAGQRANVLQIIDIDSRGGIYK